MESPVQLAGRVFPRGRHADPSRAARRGAACAGSMESAASTAAMSLRERSPRRAESGGAPDAIVDATSGSGTPQNGWLPASASQRITPTAQTSLRSLASLPSRRSGAMYASVPGTSPTAVSVSASSNWARPKSRTRAERRLAVLDEHVRGLHVAMDDPVAMRVGETLEDLRRELHRGRVVELARADQLAQRAAADVLVRDVHVAVVRAEVVRTHAALVAQARRRLHLACRACRALALPRDDLQRDVEPGLLVAGEPDRAGAAPTDRPERPIAVEDECAIGKGEGSGGHRSQSLRRERGSSSAAERAVHSSASDRSAEGPSSGGRILSLVIM